MPRRRFAVVLSIPPPISVEVDVLRRALRDRQLARVEPHITLIPPINLHDDELVDALAIVDAVTAGRRPFELTIGPVDTFDEASPVRFLAVAPWEPVVELYEACWTGVLDRPQKRSFHPHVTIDIDGGTTEGTDPAVGLLAGYTATVTIDRITVLEHHGRTDDHEPHWDTYLAHRFG